jgi:hypothetical protein
MDNCKFRSQLTGFTNPEANQKLSSAMEKKSPCIYTEPHLDQAVRIAHATLQPAILPTPTTP